MTRTTSASEELRHQSTSSLARVGTWRRWALGLGIGALLWLLISNSIPG